MKLLPTAITGAMVVEVDAHMDERGLFARTFCADVFGAHGLATHFPQCNTSQNPQRGTLRGLHYQAAPKEEAKLVRATRGRAFDVAVDLRPASDSYLQWVSVELDADRRNAFYIPAGCAHGFLTLSDDCEIFYMMSESHAPDLGRSVRWDDPAFSIDWPSPPLIMNERDAMCEDYKGVLP
ncbi:dTDP-4-dehydrorhamnose 3,5-epimerase [Blastomonas sp. AAP53]|uniref:dTDP-4-dehydrorhamnose 3,5-epimerase n=1 Tax=Blastomonas sp. AAP53 TaxID=1248760 RepID=UPI00030EA25C|nr:dTDP-4-dehydrorhamnose 3,5-epimerase [Blastomonas sp. AAP53]